jgi:hypothetical protein
MSVDDDNDKDANSISSAPYSTLLDFQSTHAKKTKTVKQLPGLQTPYARLSKTSTCEEVRPLHPPLLNQRPQQYLRQNIGSLLLTIDWPAVGVCLQYMRLALLEIMILLRKLLVRQRLCVRKPRVANAECKRDECETTTSTDDADNALEVLVRLDSRVAFQCARRKGRVEVQRGSVPLIGRCVVQAMRSQLLRHDLGDHHTGYGISYCTANVVHGQIQSSDNGDMLMASGSLYAGLRCVWKETTGNTE